jgi:hypothetical protein
MRGNKVHINFAGKVTGDKMTGTAKLVLPTRTLELNLNGERVKVSAANVAGAWKLKVALRGGPTFEPSLKLIQNTTSLSGTYTGEHGETAIADALVFGDELTFEVNRERDGKSYKLRYQCKVNGDALKGTVDYNFDGITGFVEFDGKRLSGPGINSVQKQ